MCGAGVGYEEHRRRDSLSSEWGKVESDQEDTAATKKRSTYEKKIGKQDKKQKIEGHQSAKSQEEMPAIR